jgi:citrate synthase
MWSEFSELLRLLTIVQCDHEGGNACALSASVVASALSDPYLAVSAGTNALAGPIHGLASQVCLQLLLDILEHFGQVPDDHALEQFCLARLASGRVLPGFGHAVLRAADPRYVAVREFADAHGISDSVFEVCRAMSRVGPKLLIAGGKASNPWPNIDGISGAALYHYGIVEPDFYTVIFAVSISLGVLAQYVVNRGLGRPLFRPRSISLTGLRQMLGG